MSETIRMGALELRFLRSRHDTAGSLDMFEVHCAPQGQMPQAHYHRNWEETAYGLDGVTTFTVDGTERPIARGDHLFIPRGVVHGFENRTEAPSSFLSILTPGVLGPEYFREMAALVATVPPNRDALLATMTKYGLVPVP